MTRERWAWAAVAAILVACEGAYLTAPPGSTIVVIAAPPSIPAHGGVSELSAIVTESIGTAVPDGTVVLWTTTMGQLEPETRTTNGVARNRLVSDARSGTATVTAISGGGVNAPAPGPSTSPSPGSSPSPSPPPTTLAPPTGGGRNTGTATVTIGNVLVRNVILRAVPSRITISNSTQLIATVLDEAGNPVPNVPVFFEVLFDADLDFLDSAGAARFTDNNGQAQDVLRTRRTLVGNPVRVRAVAASTGGFSVVSNVLEIPVL